jgi:hypothetical protein
VTGIFKQKSPANILLLPVFGVLLKLPMFIHPHVPVSAPQDGLLYRSLIDFLAPFGKSSPFIYPLLAFVLLFLQAVFFTRLVINNKMMIKANYLPGMSFMLLTSLLPEWNYFSAVLLVNTLLLFVLSVLLNIYNEQKAGAAIFNIGMATGIASFFFFPSVLFFIWCLFGLMLMRPVKVNEWIICLMGLLTPYYFFGIYLFVAGKWDIQAMLPYFSVHVPVVKPDLWLAGLALLLGLPFLLGGYYVQENLRKMLIQVRKAWSLMLVLLLISLLVPFINGSNNFQNWFLCVMPFAGFHACAYLYPKQRWIPAIIFWITAAFVIVYQYFGPGWR